jgi:NADH-quinone oxidoreductase subunit M
VIVAALALPLLVGLLLMIGRRRVPGRTAALLGAVAMTASLVLLVLLWDGGDGVSGEVDRAWIEPLGARLHLGVTALSFPFLLMTAVVAILCCVWLVRDDTAAGLVGLVLVISASSMGVFASLDLLVLFVFFELALVPMWFVIAWWGSSNGSVSGANGARLSSKNGARVAATRFLLFTVTGSALLLVGIVVIALDSGSLQVADMRSTSLAAVVLVCLGFAVKTPVVPLHTWLPDAHATAPTVGSVLLAAVFLKLGTYGLILVATRLDRFPDVAPWLALAGAVGIVWAALACYGQDDLKRLVAYSSIGHMGFVVVALSTGTRAGLAGAVYGSVAHGIIAAMLFFTAGALKDRHGTASMTAIGRGLYGRTPWLAVAFVLAAVASLGLPGLAGFWGELLALRSAYEGGVLAEPVAWTALGLALVGVALTTAYFVRAIRLLAQGEPVPVDGDRDLDAREAVVLGTLALGVVVLGLWPDPVLDLYATAFAAVGR